MGISARELAAATPATRDRYVDLLRVASLAVVLLGHWLMAAVTADGQVGNLLAVVPGLQVVTWAFQVMPVFFFVGGFSHALAHRSRPRYAAFLRARLQRLLRPTMVFVGVWGAAALVLQLSGADGDLHGVVVLVEAGELPAAPDVRAELGGPLLQDRLGRVLGDAAGAEVGALQDGVVELHTAEVAHRAGLQGLPLAEARQQSALVEDLHGAGREAEPAGLAGGPLKALGDEHPGAAEAQFTGEHQTGGTRADDDHVGVEAGFRGGGHGAHSAEREWTARKELAQREVTRERARSRPSRMSAGRCSSGRVWKAS